MNRQQIDRSDEAPDDLVRQAIESIEHEAIPPGPPDELVATTIRALNRLEQPRPKVLSFLPRTRVVRFAAVAAGLLLMVSWLAHLFPTAQSPPAFGEEFHRALEQVREGHSMSYVQEMKIEDQKAPIIVKEFIAEDGRKRTEMAGGHVTIFDSHGQIRLSLTESTHTALVRPDEPDHHFNVGKIFLDWLKDLKDLGDTPDKGLGERELDGKRVTGFVATQGKRTFTMWIDKSTGEPVRIEYDMKVLDSAAHITMRDFHFHQTLDDSLFSFDVPQGYQVFGQPRDGKYESPAGFELAWSKKGAWAGVARTLGRPTACALQYTGQLVEFSVSGDSVAKVELGGGLKLPTDVFRSDRAGSLRTARLVAGQKCGFLVFRQWGPKVGAYNAEGELLWSYAGPPQENWGVNDLCAADLDGDGLDEVIISYNAARGFDVLDSQGKLLWKNTDRSHVWYVTTADIDDDGKPEVLTTCIKGDIQVFKADGKRLADLTPSFSSLVVRAWQSPAEQPRGPDEKPAVKMPGCLIVVAGGGTGTVPLAVLDSSGKTLWSLELPAMVSHAAIASQQPWLATALSDGSVRVFDLVAGKEVAHLGGQGGAADVAWLPAESGPPLLVIATDRVLQAFRVTAEKP